MCMLENIRVIGTAVYHLPNGLYRKVWQKKIDFDFSSIFLNCNTYFAVKEDASPLFYFFFFFLVRIAEAKCIKSYQHGSFSLVIYSLQMDFFLRVISQSVNHALYMDDGQFTHWMWVFGISP